MNILQATTHLQNTVRAYLAKDAMGLPLIPTSAQRPVVLIGPPGIGKTAIVSQVARELGINFVSYSITHHTRQSALGLPYISSAQQGPDEAASAEVRVTRFTMSEIIAATHDAIAQTGRSEGILFLDEINCASETLMPAMLAFLQFKSFGQHRLPDGWVIVAAGNPPEYNRAARPFDPAMWDRLCRLDIEADPEIWLNYAVSHGVHPAITTYLTAKPQNFYRVRPHATGTRIVTARGWEDLSHMLKACDAQSITPELTLVSQYVQDLDIAQDFALYLELYRKYQDDYKLADILSASADPQILARAQAAPFDERLALSGMLADALLGTAQLAARKEEALKSVRTQLQQAKQQDFSLEVAQAMARSSARELVYLKSTGTPDAFTTHLAADKNELLQALAQAVARSGATGSSGATVSSDATDSSGMSASVAFEAARAQYNLAAQAVKTHIASALQQLDAAFSFMDAAFGQAEEELVCMSRLSADPRFMRFVAAHHSEAFAAHVKLLSLDARGLDLLDAAKKLQDTSETAR